VGDGGPLAGETRREAVWAALGGCLWILTLYAPLLSPGRALASREMLVFHLPLRFDLARLAADGVPWWNPWLNGGQPVLSNPNYSAFYPFSWLAAALPPHWVMGLAVIFHAALAFAGAWLLTRRLGGGRTAAALAALSLSGGGAFLSSIDVYPQLGAVAWIPWAALAADAAFSAPERRWWKPAAGCALALAFALLAGDPVAALLAAGVVACLALPHLHRQPAVAGRLAAVAALTLLLGAVQLLPTVHRVAGSERATGLAAEEAMDWSTRPLRLVEVAYPHAFGVPAQAASGRYYGWSLHDRDSAYLRSVFPGLALLVVGLAAFAAGVPRRVAWATAALLGVLLAFGRHTPLYPWLHGHLPGFDAFRYPERFLVLALVAVTFAGALGWHRLLADGRSASRWPLGVAAATLAATFAAALWVSLAPGPVASAVAASMPLPLTPEGLDLAVGHLRGGAWRAALLAAAVCGLVAAARLGRVRRELLAVAVVALLASDLWLHGSGCLRTLDAEVLDRPSPLARALAVEPGEPWRRIYFDDRAFDEPHLFTASTDEDPALVAVRAELVRLDPYAGNLWGVAYALNQDYDHALTGWGERARRMLRDAWPQREAVLRVSGAWDVDRLVFRLPPSARPERGGLPSAAAELVTNPYRLDRVRLVPEVRFHADQAAAAAAVAAQGHDVAALDHWVGDGPSGRGGDGDFEVVRRAASETVLRYRAEGGAFLVVADTYDDGWSARLDGAPLDLHPTALGQIGAHLPAGEGELVIAYRDRWVIAGVAVTLATLAALAAALLAARLRRRR